MVNFATRMGQMYSPHSLATERARAPAFRGAQKIPGARDYILQMKYKPMPRYLRGAIVPYTGTSRDVPLGRMFTQPAVENADGDRVLLDDAIGSSFALLGLHPDPADRHKHRAKPGDDWSVIVEDVDGVFRDWLLKRPADNVIVLRPDRYVAAVCPLADLERVTGRLRQTLG